MDEESAAQSRPTVLIVDDDSPIAETLAMIIEDMGYSVVLAYNGREGLAAAMRVPPNLIITDLMMPQMTGAEMLAALRATHLNMPPILVLTAGERTYAQDVGATATIAKPFDVKVLESVVRSLIEPTEGK